MACIWMCVVCSCPITPFPLFNLSHPFLSPFFPEVFFILYSHNALVVSKGDTGALSVLLITTTHLVDTNTRSPKPSTSASPIPASHPLSESQDTKQTPCATSTRNTLRMSIVMCVHRRADGGRRRTVL